MKNTLQKQIAGYRFTAQIFTRAAIVGFVIGSILLLINQNDALLGQLKLQILPMALVYLTPFVVVSLSQVFGIKAAHELLLQCAFKLQLRQGLIQTVFSHGILLRAIILGAVVGSLNTAIVATVDLLAGKSLGQLPLPLILQALTLPIIFGALSQALSFRRTIKQST